jgi:hypothetical protein
VKWHLFHINEAARDERRGRRPLTGAKLLHQRLFFHLYRREDGPELASGHLELVVPRRLQREFSLRAHVGNSGSETPLDAHATICGAGVYAGLDPGRWFRPVANVLSGSRSTGDWQTSRYRSRDLALSWHSGSLWWRLWADPDRSSGRRWRWPWQDKPTYHSWAGLAGNARINPKDWLYGGPPRFTYVDHATAEAFLTPAEGYDGDGPYLVRFTLQQQFRGRRRGPQDISWVADWECREGIPTQNHPWKGDCTYASAVPLPQLLPLTVDQAVASPWLEHALVALQADVTRERARYQYQWPGREHYLDPANR